MTRSRLFLPPSSCNQCNARPVLGSTLIHTGTRWLCASCLTQELPGSDVTTKQAARAIAADGFYAQSRRARVAGEIEQAERLNQKAQWHHEVSDAVREHGNRMAQTAVIVGTEVLPTKPGYLKDTLIDPDLVAIEASEARGHLLKMNDALSLGVDLSNTVQAANTAEKLISHEIAVAHKVAMEQAMRASHESDPVLEVKRLQVSARMMNVAQNGLLALQRIKSGGTQNMIVQHVHVEAGGQAVVGSVQTSSHSVE